MTPRFGSVRRLCRRLQGIVVTAIKLAVCLGIPSSTTATPAQDIAWPLPIAAQVSERSGGIVLDKPLVDLLADEFDHGKAHPPTVEWVDPQPLEEPLPLSQPLPTYTTADVWTRDRFEVGYERGFFIRPREGEDSPFKLLINFQDQFRYTGFVPAQETWTDSAGVVRLISERNGFDIIRGRVIFSGTAVDPDLSYYLNLDYGTTGDDRVTVLLGWMSYRFSRSFELFWGKGKVPGGREWLMTSMFSHAPDRTMATTFFRPSITTGVWARGKPTDELFYQAIIGNGFNTSAAGFRDLDTNLLYSGNLGWEPWGEFGGLYSDLPFRDLPAVRFGTSLTQSRQSGRQFDASAAEQTFIRLSDGTDLTQPDALFPGVTVTDYSVSLATLDAGWKHRGRSLNAEYFLRWLYDFRGTGPISSADRSLFDHGFYVQGGTFFVPRRWEWIARTSQVFGERGNGAEYAAGVNWFPKGTESWRVGADVTYLNRSPASQLRTGYEAGATGTMFRVQVQMMF
ncbi:MAG: porin [Planctomycetaceae bacterium]|nr:MAG: porin [Planctomycetaceae bacterium]